MQHSEGEGCPVPTVRMHRGVLRGAWWNLAGTGQIIKIILSNYFSTTIIHKEAFIPYIKTKSQYLVVHAVDPIRPQQIDSLANEICASTVEHPKTQVQVELVRGGLGVQALEGAKATLSQEEGHRCHPAQEVVKGVEGVWRPGHGLLGTGVSGWALSWAHRAQTLHVVHCTGHQVTWNTGNNRRFRNAAHTGSQQGLFQRPQLQLGIGILPAVRRRLMVLRLRQYSRTTTLSQSHPAACFTAEPQPASSEPDEGPPANQGPAPPPPLISQAAKALYASF
ncbi:hypothetical protein F7725_022660 [Dissostichus mawsoni]|uniref:Uncharacterized protein n=1 Tax=Dissostichus mawsoni TaxID=36200 RepID=A0A7J5YYK0_DISMA|nr:hypothetical protein F7725_022660 [Dissostichus mawsoni]